MDRNGGLRFYRYKQFRRYSSQLLQINGHRNRQAYVEIMLDAELTTGFLCVYPANIKHQSTATTYKWKMVITALKFINNIYSLI